MNSLFVLYSALAVFGVGVTIVDLFGVFEHAASSGGGSGHDSGDGADGADDGGDSGDSGVVDSDGADSGDGADGADGGGSGDDADGGDGSDGGADAGHDAGNGHGDVIHGSSGDHDGHDYSHDHGHDHGHGLTHVHLSHDHPVPARGFYVASAESGTRLVAGAIGALRTGVYFSLGAGPTGLFALFTGLGAAESLAWSAVAGIGISVLVRLLRGFIRKDLDSSINMAEFIMDEATISVPVEPGAMGKAIVRRYGRETEVYVRAMDASLAIPKGSSVRLVDLDDDCFRIEPL